jgi:hypothetical protein
MVMFKCFSDETHTLMVTKVNKLSSLAKFPRANARNIVQRILSKRLKCLAFKFNGTGKTNKAAGNHRYLSAFYFS